jgi:hypothetical protein
MTYYAEHTTVYNVRNVQVGNTQTGQDAFYLDLIRSISSDIDNLSGRRFVPRVETLRYDTPKGSCLKFNGRDVLEVTTLTNGDGTVIASTYYFLDEYNDFPKWQIRLKPSSGLVWTLDTDGEAGQAIQVAAITGYHANYADAWVRVDTLGAAITDTTTAAFTTTGSALIHAGELLKIDSEFFYASSVSTVTTTSVRNVNGSTAATHLNGAVIYKWVNPSVEMIARNAVLAQAKLKDNPIGETVAIGGYQFNTPKDVTKYIKTRLSALGLVRIT